MKRMLTCLFTFFCGSCAFASADFLDTNTYQDRMFSDSYSYMSAGLGTVNSDTATLIPGIGIGYRQRFTNQWGWDTSLNYATIGKAHQASMHALVHYYLNSDDQNAMYIGTGVRVNGFLANKKRETAGAVSLDTVVGKALASDGFSSHFIELHVCSPNYWSTKKVKGITCATAHKFSAMPMMYLTYGVGF